MTADPSGLATVGDLNALIIRDGDPDRVAIIGNDSGAESCTEFLDSIPRDFLDNGGNYHLLEAGSTIETG